MTSRLRRLAIGPGDRLLVIAPHPDDEAISCGLTIQKALNAGASVHVVLLTMGDAFGFAGAAVGKRGASRRANGLGAARYRESVRALAYLGVDPSRVIALGYPDRGIAAMWGRHWHLEAPFRSRYTSCTASPYAESLTPGTPYAGEVFLSDLTTVLQRIKPTLCLYPHPHDAHTDHAVGSVFVTYALERLATEEAWAQNCRRLYYLVHRGAWPSPRGPNIRLPLRPPAGMEALRESWLEVVGEEAELKSKYRAILMYRSQIPPLGRFLTSFVRKNELFSVARSWEVDRLLPGALVVGGESPLWPGGPTLTDPVGDSVTRQMSKAGDIVQIQPRTDGHHLCLRLVTAGRISDDVEYRVTLTDCPRSRQLVLRLKPSHRVTQVVGKELRLAREVVARAKDSRLELAVPGGMLGNPSRIFVHVETRSRGITIDRTGHYLLHVPTWHTADPKQSPVIYAAATPADLAACAAIFAVSFRESLLHIFKKMPSQRLIQEVFRLCLDAEPSALMVAVAEGRVVGYVFAPSSLTQVWKTALFRRHLLRWAGSWMRGRFGVGLGPLRVILLDKVYFLRSSIGREAAAEARILSIAVSPEMRGRGIATRLVDHALERFRHRGIKRVRLEVRPWNEPALRVYSRLGFETVGVTRDSQGEWAVMLCDL